MPSPEYTQEELRALDVRTAVELCNSGGVLVMGRVAEARVIELLEKERDLTRANDRIAELEAALEVAKDMLRTVRDEGIDAHKEMWGCEECNYGSTSLCGRICSVLGET